MSTRTYSLDLDNMQVLDTARPQVEENAREISQSQGWLFKIYNIFLKIYIKLHQIHKNIAVNSSIYDIIKNI